MFGRPKRTVPKPEVVTSHKSDNPMFHNQSTPELHRFRQRVLMAFGVVSTIVLLGVAVFGPWLEVTTVEVIGTRALNPSSVQSVTKTYLEGESWLILPRRNIWLLSGNNLAKYLKTKISSKLSIEAVAITKKYPHRLIVNITERTPVFIWTNGQGFATLDRQGVLIELHDQPVLALDLVQDGLATAFLPDQQVIIPEVAGKLLELQAALRRNNFTIKEFIIPTPVCPLAIPSPEELAAVNTNVSNVNTEDQKRNTNSSPRDNVNAIEPEVPPCDLLDLRQQSQEIHVRIKDGALVLFDRHSNLDGAVTTLTRLLTQPENVKATYIDVRFEERVYIR